MQRAGQNDKKSFALPSFRAPDTLLPVERDDSLVPALLAKAKAITDMSTPPVNGRLFYPIADPLQHQPTRAKHSAMLKRCLQAYLHLWLVKLT